MRKLWEDTRYFLQNRCYIIIVSLVAALSYGFVVSHPTVGIDDTAIGMYFGDGLAPAMGRWFLYLLNKVISLDSFLPWMTELVSVIILVLSVTLWCVLWYRIIGNQVPMLGYAAFAALFISCPLISEVFIYYLHNGICTAYGLTALSLLFVLEAAKKENADKENTDKKSTDKENTKKKIGYIAASVAFLTAALGCYESFVTVYIIGMLLMFFLIRENAQKENHVYGTKPIVWARWTLFIVIGSVLMRSVVLKVLGVIYGYSIPDNFTVSYRNIFENLGQSQADLFMSIKKFWVMYYLNGVCYLPITVLVMGIVVLLGVGVYKCIRKKDPFLFLSMLAVPIVPVCMVLVEGMPTHYRASQYVPLIGAFAVFLIFKSWNFEKTPKMLSGIGTICVIALTWNQIADMNRWFYIDYLKYEDAKTVMSHIAYDLESEYDTSKPIVFRGAYYVPYGISKDAYLPFYSDEYRFMKSIADVVDVHLLEKFNAENGVGYAFAQTPINSTLRWGVTAFDKTAGQLQKFWEMHGYSLKVETDLEKIAEAETLRGDMPGYPKKGYIKETEEYIIVNFSSVNQ